MRKDMIKVHNKLLQFSGRTLFNVYEKPSVAKIRAWEKIVEETCAKDTVIPLTIISYNTFAFTCAYAHIVYENASPSVYLVYHTPSKRIEVELTDIM